MALITAGTNTTTSLSGLKWFNNGASISKQDIYGLAKTIKDDLINGHPIYPGAFDSNNMLFIPNRGFIKVLPGDYVLVDSTGWPILVSANAIANGPWTHT